MSDVVKEVLQLTHAKCKSMRSVVVAQARLDIHYVIDEGAHKEHHRGTDC